MTPPRIANKDCRAYVKANSSFDGSNLFASHRVVGTYPHTNCRHYSVYSYGFHYPMFIFVPEVGWFENEDRFVLPNGGYSRSTERQRSLSHPHERTFKLSTDAMRYLDDYGYRKFTQNYLITGEMA